MNKWARTWDSGTASSYHLVVDNGRYLVAACNTRMVLRRITTDNPLMKCKECIPIAESTPKA